MNDGNCLVVNLGLESGMETFGERIAKVRKERGMTQNHLADIVGIAQPTLCDLENGKSAGTRYILALAKALQVNVEWLQFGTGNSSESTKEVSLMRRVAMAIPVLEWQEIALWRDLVKRKRIDSGAEYVLTDADVGQNTFAARFSGGAMEPNFKQGTVVTVEPSLQPQSGDHVFIQDQGAVILRTLIQDGAAWLLVPTNKNFPVREISSLENVVGVVREARSTFR